MNLVNNFLKLKVANHVQNNDSFCYQKQNTRIQIINIKCSNFRKEQFFWNKNDNIRVSKDAIKKSGNQIKKFKQVNYFIL